MPLSEWLAHCRASYQAGASGIAPSHDTSASDLESAKTRTGLLERLFGVRLRRWSPRAPRLSRLGGFDDRFLKQRGVAEPDPHTDVSLSARATPDDSRAHGYTLSRVQRSEHACVCLSVLVAEMPNGLAARAFYADGLPAWAEWVLRLRNEVGAESDSVMCWLSVPIVRLEPLEFSQVEGLADDTKLKAASQLYDGPGVLLLSVCLGDE